MAKVRTTIYDAWSSSDDDSDLEDSSEEAARCCYGTCSNPLSTDHNDDEIQELNCGHWLHVSCRQCHLIDVGPEVGLRCPICKHCYKIYGNQPAGEMTIQSIDTEVPGFADATGAIKITCNFSSGVQGPRHPHPEKRYKGERRVTYLPNNAKGRMLLGLLQRAFEQRLIFIIGKPDKTGEPDVIRWNPDFWHKSSITGGERKFGYPDKGYLRTLEYQLATYGILPEREEPPQPTRPADKRKLVIDELVDTEERFVQKMNILIEEYLKKMKEKYIPHLLPRYTAIYTHQRNLLGLLKRKLEKWNDTTTVGDILQEVFGQEDVVKSYVDLIKGWGDSETKLRAAKDRKTCIAVLKNVDKKLGWQHRIDSLLLEPVQRIPRYELLIKEVLKHTDPSHPDCSLLQSALKTIHHLAEAMNSSSRQTQPP